MTNIISAQPYPAPNPAPLPLEPENLATELALLGERRMIEIICDLSARLRTVEWLLDLAPSPCATPTAAPTAPVREIVEDLGNGWRAERTLVLKPHQTAQDGQGRAQPPEPV